MKRFSDLPFVFSFYVVAEYGGVPIKECCGSVLLVSCGETGAEGGQPASSAPLLSSPAKDGGAAEHCRLCSHQGGGGGGGQCVCVCVWEWKCVWGGGLFLERDGMWGGGVCSWKGFGKLNFPQNFFSNYLFSIFQTNSSTRIESPGERNLFMTSRKSGWNVYV